MKACREGLWAWHGIGRLSKMASDAPDVCFITLAFPRENDVLVFCPKGKRSRRRSEGGSAGA